MKRKGKKSRKISFLADKGLVRIVDEYCRRTGQNRSHMIRSSLVFFLSEHHSLEGKEFDPLDPTVDLSQQLGKYFLSIAPPKGK